MSPGNIEIVRRAYEEAYAKRSVEGTEDWVSEDFRFHPRAEFIGRSSYTRDEILEFWTDLNDTYSEFSIVAEDYAEAGDHVVATMRQSARLRDSDLRVESTVYHVWQVRDGQAIAAWVYGDRAEALEAAGIEE